ncbi:MAG: hypothetical protein PHO02_05145, partial [Candidatus Nanoarchaeia archaeon]|nr:hypothetical protein [Candidatus Nanoarchaeia archaeon]
HFDNAPMVDSKPKETAIKLARRLAEITNSKIKMYIVNHGNNQTEISSNINRRYQCVLCKRMMLRIAGEIAAKEKADFIITGDNLGQVASQTLQNIAVIESVVKIPVIRPLLCNDKNEIIKIANEIGTYEDSIRVHSCCTALPDNPVTKARKEAVEIEEKKINIHAMADNAVKEAEIFEI